MNTCTSADDVLYSHSSLVDPLLLKFDLRLRVAILNLYVTIVVLSTLKQFETCSADDVDVKYQSVSGTASNDHWSRAEEKMSANGHDSWTCSRHFA